jgi:hypothetical protein
MEQARHTTGLADEGLAVFARLLHSFRELEDMPICGVGSGGDERRRGTWTR